MKEGRKEKKAERKEGREKGRTEGRKDVTQKRSKDSRKEEEKVLLGAEGWKTGRKAAVNIFCVQMEERSKEGKKEGRKEGGGGPTNLALNRRSAHDPRLAAKPGS